MRVLILTGQSGSGKSTAIRALEDHGSYCVDNLPTDMVPELLTLAETRGKEQVALVMDARDSTLFGQLPELVQMLREGPHSVRVVYFEASEEALIRRYSETRRKHPLDASEGLRTAILKEQALMAPLRELADETIETSNFTPHRLKAHVEERLVERSSGDEMRVSLLSFGFKYGVPQEADLVFDVRFLPNPYFDPELRPLSGMDQPVFDFVAKQDDTKSFLEELESMLKFLLPRYQREGKRYLTLAIGCTGGQHRSVSLCRLLAPRLAGAPTVHHRDCKGRTP